MATAELNFSTGFIPDAVRSFYDPNHYFADPDWVPFDPIVNYYVDTTLPPLTPTESSDDKLLAWLDTKRQEPIVLPHIGPVVGRQLLATELTHTGMITEENAHQQEWLGISTSDVEQAVAAVNAATLDTANWCLGAIRTIRSVARKDPLGDTSEIVLAGAILAANSHKGVDRLNKKPFYSHPQGVALLLRGAYLNYLSPDSDLTLEMYEFKGLTHDTFEDTLRKDAKSFLLSQNLIASPLAQATTLRRLEVPESIAHDAIASSLVLTKPVGPKGDMYYAPNIELVKARPQDIPVKEADTQNNSKIDPKPPLMGVTQKERNKNAQVYKKLAIYDWSQRELRTAYANSDAVNNSPNVFRKLMFLNRILSMTKTDVDLVHTQTPWAKISHLELINAYETMALAA